MLDHLRGVNVMCAALLDLVESCAGEVFTYAPPEVLDDQLYAFDRGGLLPINRDFSRAVSLGPGLGWAMQTIDIRDLQADCLLTCADAANLCVLIDDVTPDWGEPHAADLPSAFGVGSEVYHLLPGATDAATLAVALRSSDGLWHGVAAACDPDPGLKPGQLCEPAALKAAASSARLLTCSAYDGEGFVGWRREAEPGR